MKKASTKVAMIVFLLGIAMGALDSGIVAPARNIIAGGLNISQSSSIWMITIYTLAYAVAMPIMGKLSDKFGRKKIYLISIILFAVGSLLCGLSNIFESYTMLLIFRVIEAIGGGGIMPIATTYIGTSFPPEKRGSALGFIGAIFGICTVVGPTLGSALLQIFGDKNWGVLFFINIPISIVVIILGFKLEESVGNTKKSKLDLFGATSLGIVILSIMYALTNLKFDNFYKSLTSKDVLPYLIIFVVFIPIFIFAEKRAEDPVLNLNYFKNKDIVIVLIVSLIVGAGLMALIFLPQFSDNVLKLPSGTGGYFSTIFAVFMGISSVLSGKLIDKIGGKFVLIFGFIISIAGCLYFALVTANHPGIANLLIGIAILGSGFGFTFATPLNYLMLALVPESEATMGQSTIALVRSIGVAVGPNLLVNFISNAAQNVPKNLAAVMPKLPSSMMAHAGNMAGSATSSAFQNASANNIYSLMHNLVTSELDKVPTMLAKSPEFLAFKTHYLQQLVNSKDAITTAFQSTLDKGYGNLFLASAVFCIVAFIFSLFLSNKGAEKSNTN
ncbi:MFS transporter [uncultured Clostridium sp.]|uniref:MFS transporter n=1 Tax=uncultured Clostridium sp. TaxID=59620 RepID=UPI002633A11C|nr:MFS transporter [uncultured Clostridium sp.]